MSGSSAHDGALAPSAWIARFAPMLATGASVLDVACGQGRHARLFAARGCPVTAVDRDRDALAALRGVDGISVTAADLEGGEWPLGNKTFDAVIVANYLHRPLFPALLAAIASGGLLLYETFAAGNEAFGKPSNPDFLLQPGELLQRAAGLRIIAFEDGYQGTPRPAMVQRIAARRCTPQAQLPIDQVAL